VRKRIVLCSDKEAGKKTRLKLVKNLKKNSLFMMGIMRDSNSFSCPHPFSPLPHPLFSAMTSWKGNRFKQLY
jgi:hypothetical protein